VVRNKKSALFLAIMLFILWPLGAALCQESEGFLRGFSLQGRIGYMDVTQASQSFKAIFNSSGGLSFGGGVKIDFAKGFFFETSFDYLHRSGYRAFVSGDKVFQTDLDTNVTIAPLSFSGGYQFLRNKNISPYVGGGLSFCYFKEKEYISWEDTSSSWHSGFHLLGGMEFLKRDKVSLSVEGKWSHVPDVIGHHGVSAYYEETNIGGLSVIFKVNFHLK